MNSPLEKLHARIKYSRLYKTKYVERLYIPFGQNTKEVKTLAWLEVINDKLKVCCKVENYKKQDLCDIIAAANYKSVIEQRFYELINDCELERRIVPLHERLKNETIPVYEENSLLHQVDALRFCCSMNVSALYADTGTGKSKIAIDLVISRYEAKQIKKALVFLPISTKVNFQKQIGLWGKNYPQIEWKLIGQESMGCSDRTVLEAFRFINSETQIIIDESHMIKTPTAKRSKRIASVCEKTSYKLVMTGTPVTDNIHNLYMQYACLSPLIIGVRHWKKFEEKYLVMGGRTGNEIIGYKNIDYLMGLLEPYTYQITKEECLNLPAKQFLSHICKMNQQQYNLYQEEKKNLLDKIKSDNFVATDIFQTFTRMQQICCGYHKGEYIGTEKFELMENIPADEQVIFFCKFVFEIDMLVQYFKQENCAIFTGKNPKKRDNELADFIAGRKKYFIATMQSGGTGLNGLQKICRRIVFFSNSFSYFQRKQSIGRIDRQGQKFEMMIHDFRTNANIDEKIIQNLRRKGNLADEIKQLMHDKTKLKKYLQNL
jgi:hypothetical protein